MYPSYIVIESLSYRIAIFKVENRQISTPVLTGRRAGPTCCYPSDGPPPFNSMLAGMRGADTSIEFEYLQDRPVDPPVCAVWVS